MGLLMWMTSRGELHRLLEREKTWTKHLEEQLRDAHAKLNYVGQSMETTDGTFTFPDGDYIETRRKSNGR